MSEKPIPNEAIRVAQAQTDEKGYDKHLKEGAESFDPVRIKEKGARFLHRHAKNMSKEELAYIKRAQESLEKYGF